MAQKWTTEDIPSLSGKLAVVTGANRGLGLEIATGLAGADARVILACRDPAKAEPARQAILLGAPRAQIEVMKLNLADLSSVRRFAEEFRSRSPRLDLLVNNASSILVPLSKTADGFEMHIGVNHFGTFALTGLLLDSLRAATAARIVNTSSTAHRMTKGLDFADINFEHAPYKPMDAYGKSKLATLLFTFELDRRLRKVGADTIAVASHPGYSSTNPDKHGFLLRVATAIFAQSAAMGALSALYAATAPGVAGGEYYGPGGMGEMGGYPAKVGTAPTARDLDVAARLWTISGQATGVSYLET